MVFGTFDGLHQGHLNFFSQARKLVKNPFLIVSVAQDKNVLKIKSKYPQFNNLKRKKLVGACELVNKVVLSGVKEHLPHILKEAPEIIALGYDQEAYVKNLKRDLRKAGLSVRVVRLKPYKEKIYKNHLLKKKSRI